MRRFIWGILRDLTTPSVERPNRIDPNKVTYRYLRIGMFGVVLLLLTSVAIERSGHDCWQASVSAYYYTPVRTIFVGGMMAIGFALVVIRGYTPAQDILLNLAGMLAPVVAIVPTTNVGECQSVRPRDEPVVNGKLADWVTAAIDNNIRSLLWVGFAGLLLAFGLVVKSEWERSKAGRGGWSARPVVGVGSTTLLVGAALLLYRYWDSFDFEAHGWAANTMFFILGSVVALDAIVAHKDRGLFGYRGIYTVIAVGMVGSVLVVYAVRSSREWHHATLVLELIEIVLFAAYWLVQTRQNWSENVGPEVHRGPGGGTPEERQKVIERREEAALSSVDEVEVLALASAG